MSETDQPSVPLSTLLANPSLGLSQVAGPDEDRLISTVGTTEVEDPAPYVVGGELLLTAGVRLPREAHGIDTYVSRVVAAGVAALGFGVAPVHLEIPAELVTACDRYGLPLLRLPPHTPFVAVGQATYAAIAEVRNRELRRISKAQSALASAAARADALQAVLQQLSAHVEAWSVLFDGQGNELLSAGRRPVAPGPQLARDLAVRTVARATRSHPKDRPPPPTAAAHHHEGLHLTVHTLPGMDGATAPLALGQIADTAPTLADRQVTSMATVLLSLLTSPSHALGTDTRSVGALVQLMLGATPAEVAPALVAAVDPAGDHWIVVHGRHVPPQSTTTPPSGEVAARLAALATALGTPYLHIDGSSLRALIPAVPGTRPTAPPQAAALGWTLGFSAAVPVTELAGADTQAERALERALAREAPAVVHQTDAHTLHALVAPVEARELARARFAPLSQTSTPGAGALLVTLRTWLAFHGTWDRTAAALDIHRNTVRHRLARVAELLDVDLRDPDTRMELWFALQWLPDDAF
ncbi:PucR family transcriptional regulator [Streptomyces sp. 891-h]|uniref:PucR family transcriptional regulator n=1 Tax=Streptomyces sp. 891-h TaxID=2720714 RepID=UPI001FAAE66A|nr:PucR family transcriptional regulator [Streptomyces sp. 891-h]UNZ15802.1 PucR family transcriptional regulator [Streptomyces sp. 891-h]